MTKPLKNNYAKFCQEYLDVFQPLFEAAWDASEFEVILTLLGIRGSSDAGWDAFENTTEVAEEVAKQQKKFRHRLRGNMNLWNYVHLIESAEHFEIVANLLNIVHGESYRVANHKSKAPKFHNLKISDKISRLKKFAKGSNFENVSQPFEDTYDSRFRNAIGHSDYAFKGGSVTVVDDVGFPTIYSEQEVLDLVNRANALHEVLVKLKGHFLQIHTEPDNILSSEAFGRGQSLKMQLIVREGEGVIGVQGLSNETDDGKPFMVKLYKCLPYEKPLIDKDEVRMPRNRIKRWNNLANKFPEWMATRISKAAGSWINRKSHH